jgi:type IX secretion system substrate protein/VCBS repeat protein
MKQVSMLLFIFFLFKNTYSQQFTEIPANIIGAHTASADWGDYDNDGDLDLVVIGDTSQAASRYCSKIYRNDDSVFTDIDAPLTKAGAGSAEWGDYDNDGDLDLIIIGFINDMNARSTIYRNEQGNFVNINAPLRHFERGNATWGDYDNDGDLDVLVVGASLPNGIFTRIYENVALNTFNERDIGLPGIFLGCAGWIDYDNDMDLDIFISGEDHNRNLVSKLYINDNCNFTDSGISFPNISFSYCTWGDYDNDGDSDLFLAGFYSNSSITRVYRNDGTSFTNINANLELVSGSAYWGDVNNDNFLDLIIAGYQSSGGSFSGVYRNLNGSFSLLSNLYDINAGASIMGDYDNDEDLDIFLIGSGISKLYRNNETDTSMTIPILDGLNSMVQDRDVLLNWNPVDTTAGGFSYNVRVGTSPGSCNILSPMSDLNTGYRKITRMGNSGYITSKFLKNLQGGTYYWSVQAINHQYRASDFSQENTFIVFYDTTNSAPQVKNNIPDQALVYGRDVFNRNLFTSPNIFNDPDGDLLYFSAISTDTSVAFVSVSGIDLSVIPVDTGHVEITVFATDSISGTAQTTFDVWIILLPNNTTFMEISHNIENISESSIEWGDFDNDEDLDLVISGIDNNYLPVTEIYENINGDFFDINAGLINIYTGDVAWGDYDNDKDLDLIIAGRSSSATITKIYRNDSSHFVDAQIPLINVRFASLAWGDYDNDGDLDLLISGHNDGLGFVTKIYKNDLQTFVEIPSNLPGIYYGDLNWGDYDNDKDLDILLSGESSAGRITKIFRNDDSQFIEDSLDLEGVNFCSSDFGDFDNDGDLDILLSGQGDTDPISKIYQNINGNFVDLLAPIDPVRGGGVVWGDYDNDGDFDVLVTGYNELDTTYTAKIYENYKGCFVDVEINFLGVDFGDIAWGDYDNDNDLDFILTGINYQLGGSNTKIYRNEMQFGNTAPAAPLNLNTQIEGGNLLLTWDMASDIETDSLALTYNIRVGTTPGGEEIISSMSESTNGYRFRPVIGNVNHNTQWSIKNISSGNIYWSVQTIDNCFKGSVFSSEQSFFVSNLETKSDSPLKYHLSQNYPNPFNPSTTIKYELIRSMNVKIDIFNLIGQRIKTVLNKSMSAGTHEIEFNVNDLPSGIYFYRIEAGEFKKVKKMLLLK